jgi:hypothetical protein
MSETKFQVLCVLIKRGVLFRVICAFVLCLSVVTLIPGKTLFPVIIIIIIMTVEGLLTWDYTDYTEMLRISHCLDSQLTNGGKVVSPMHRPHFTPQKYYYFVFVSGTHEAE